MNTTQASSNGKEPLEIADALQVMSMDPSQRKMLEVSYEAFESAGEPWETFSGSKTGVFVGSMNSDHSIMQAYDMDFTLPHASTGGSTSILSNRINHVFNLRGPRYEGDELTETRS
jgi:acyl transferase domain-containing protein